MKSIPQISKELGVPVATLRYRLQAYEDFLPYKCNNKGTKEYSEETEAVIRDINSYCDEKKSQEDIMLLLSTKYARDIEIINESTATTTNDQQMMYQQLVRFNDTMEKLVEYMDKQHTMQQDVNDMKVAIGELSRSERHKKGFWSRLWG